MGAQVGHLHDSPAEALRLIDAATRYGAPGLGRHMAAVRDPLPMRCALGERTCALHCAVVVRIAKAHRAARCQK